MVEFANAARPMGRAQVDALEKALGCKLPAPYRAFLMEHNGGEPTPGAFSYMPGWPAQQRVQRFLPGASLLATRDELQGRIPAGALPVGFDPGGNALLLGVEKGELQGAVHFPMSRSLGKAKEWHDFMCVAADFGWFLEHLRAPGERQPRGAAPPAKPAAPRVAKWTPPKRPLPRGPLPTTKAGYRDLVTHRLEALRKPLIADLRRRVFAMKLPEGTKSLDFEIHHRQLDATVPIVGYLMDESRGQVQVKARGGKRVLAPNVDVLPACKAVIPRSSIKPYLEADVETLEVHTPLLMRWFVSAWSEAEGSKRFTLPASIMLHDGGVPVPLTSAHR